MASGTHLSALLSHILHIPQDEKYYRLNVRKCDFLHILKIMVKSYLVLCENMGLSPTIMYENKYKMGFDLMEMLKFLLSYF